MTATVPPGRLAGRAPWWGLPPVIEDAPSGVQIVQRVRNRYQHRMEYAGRSFPWLDPDAADLPAGEQ